MTNLPTFIAVDGEGVTRPDTKEHIYDMLSIGDRTLTSPDGSQLQWYQIFEFLWDCFQDDKANKIKKATYVGFFLGYDFTQWTCTLPEKKGIDLWSKKGQQRRRRFDRVFPVDCKAPDGTVWKFDILAGKRFQLQKEDNDEKGIMFINDAGPFFQTSFINVIAPQGKIDTSVVSVEDFEIIQEGKANRGHEMFLPEQMATREETIRYNLMENRVLTKVMDNLALGLSSIEINLNTKQWYGPGQSAQAWMKLINVEDAETMRENLTAYAFEAAQASYYGGWFEIFNHGHVPGVVFEYDINSAYPAEIASLPCLTCGAWEILGDDDEPRPGSYTLTHATVHGANDDMGPLPFRTPQGRILRPLNTEGWYWQSEIEAAERAGLVDTYEVHEKLSYVPMRGCDHGENGKPFHEIAELYKKRLEVGKNTPAGKAYKLVYNSAYGKMAQSIGNPQFASAVYASLITSGCRVRILDAIATHPVGVDDVVMVATDGIYFRSEHDNLEIDGQKLGAWDVAKKENLTLLMPGVYWDDKARKDAASIELKSRGINAKTLAKEIGRLDTLFTDLLTSLDEDSLEETFTVYSEFDMITPGSACNMNNWRLAGTLNTYEKDGKTYVGSKRDISTSPSLKRDTSRLWLDRGSIRSTAYEYAQDNKGEEILATTPYDKYFGFDIQELNNEFAFVAKDFQGSFINFTSSE